MKMYLFLLATILFLACGSKPKVISAENGGTTAGMAAHAHAGADANADAHTVLCKEFMHAEKYTYMDVEENGSRFWIAVPRQEVEKGATYHYSGGLKKTNFKSTEFDRVFETIVLVSGITPHVAGSSGSAVDRALAQTNQSPQSAPASSASVGNVKIAELFKNRAKYEGKTITVSGTCVKINKMIMGRNWVHLDDGTVSGKDLTVTTMADVPVGTTTTLVGTITLNKDFGAGYKYEVIMENAQVE
jgi:hypothetical protein